MASAADPLGQSAMRYSRVAMWFHWILAALIVANLFLGLFHEDFGRAATPWMMFYHKATGITILALSLARLLWRLGHRPPPFDQALRPWEALLARITHWLFYVLMIAIPLTGWMLSSSSGRTTNYFGLFEIGLLPVSRSDAAHDLFEELHEILGKLMIGLILLHLAGALKHHLQGHRHLIGRMGPWLYRQR
ncbi:MAG TPA: cytochrome b [Allosphingosinicella sp.]|nr:cytochrome b [Allosphingosinicella sp.]